MKEPAKKCLGERLLQTSFGLRIGCAAGSLLLFAPWTYAQSKAQRSVAPQSEGERRGTLNLEAARGNPLQLHNLLKKMPKGADLHNHLSGAVYAESWIRAAAEDQLCVNLASLSFAKPGNAGCGNGKVLAEEAYKDQHLFDALVDAFSMRGFVPSPGVTAHDHFFDAFAKFGGTSRRHLGEWLDEVATRADAQNEQYLELMHTPEFGHAASIAAEIGWQENLGQFREALMARGLRDEVATAKAQIDEAEALRRQR